MEKTKLGLSVSAVSAIVFLMFLFGGYTPALLVVGYILFAEPSAELKRIAIFATALALAFSTLNALVGLIPGIYGVVETFLDMFDLHISGSFLNSIANFLYSLLSLVKTVVFVGLAIYTSLGKSLNLKDIDKPADEAE